MIPDEFFGRCEPMTAEQEKRLEFLKAYEDLGPGGLTPEEQRELSELRSLATFGKIRFDDVDTSDELLNTGTVTSDAADDIKNFFEKLMKSKIFKTDGDVT